MLPFLSSTHPRLVDTKVADTAECSGTRGVVVVVVVATTPGFVVGGDVVGVGAIVVEPWFVTDTFGGEVSRVATTPTTVAATAANARPLANIRQRRALVINARARISTPSR
jgi:hypothetical protein